MKLPFNTNIDDFLRQYRREHNMTLPKEMIWDTESYKRITDFMEQHDFSFSDGKFMKVKHILEK